MSDYKLLDAGDFEKLEVFGPYKIKRPSPAAVWPKTSNEQWDNVDAQFTRFSSGDGEWKKDSLPKEWRAKFGNIELYLSQTGFGHLGVFPEQQNNWNRFSELCTKQTKVINLFAYTGAATLACAKSGASVVHLDASKTSVEWAKRNSELNGLGDASIRYIVDDALKFAQKEVRRGNKYDGIILDPPSFGRGAKGQVWKIEEDMKELLDCLRELRSETFSFVSLSSHSPGYTPLALENLLRYFQGDSGGSYTSHEMQLGDSIVLPAGATSIWTSTGIS